MTEHSGKQANSRLQKKTFTNHVKPYLKKNCCVSTAFTFSWTDNISSFSYSIEDLDYPELNSPFLLALIGVIFDVAILITLTR